MVMSFNVFDPSRQPAGMQELSEGERLLVWSYRRWVLGMQTREEGHWIRVWRELGCVLGTDGARTALGGLQRLIREVAIHARRPVRLHPPCCGMVCADELSIVSLVAACQRGDHQRARHAAEWLVKGDGTGDLMEAGRIVADTLAGRRLLLPNRMGPDTGAADWSRPESQRRRPGARKGAGHGRPADSARPANDPL